MTDAEIFAAAATAVAAATATAVASATADLAAKLRELEHANHELRAQLGQAQTAQRAAEVAREREQLLFATWKEIRDRVIAQALRGADGTGGGGL